MFVWLIILLATSALFYFSMYYLAYAYTTYDFDNGEINKHKANLKLAITLTVTTCLTVLGFNFTVASLNNNTFKLVYVFASLGAYVLVSIILFIIGGVKNKQIVKKFHNRKLTVEDILEEQNKELFRKNRRNQTSDSSSMLPIYMMTGLAMGNSMDGCDTSGFDSGGGGDCSGF